MKLTGTNGQTNNTNMKHQQSSKQSANTRLEHKKPASYKASKTNNQQYRQSKFLQASTIRLPNNQQTPREWVRIEDFAVVMAQEKRPIPFRTWKLSPGTVMVLHARACGRVTHCRITRYWRLATMTAASLQPYSTHEHLR